MDIDLQNALLIVTSVVTAASIVLKTVAPLTKTKKDDKVLKVLNKVLRVLSLHTSDSSKKRK